MVSEVSAAATCLPADGDEKVVWIFNHYAEEPKTGTGLRHYHFARFLKGMGWKPIIFAASVVHNTTINFIEDDSPYIVRCIDDVPFVHVKTRSCEGNGKDRILNMIDYWRMCKKVMRGFARPSVVYASSVHPLAWSVGLKAARLYGVPCVTEVRDLWPRSIVDYGYLKEKSPVTRLMYAYEHSVYKRSDALIFTLAGGYDYVNDMGWSETVPSSKVFWLTNGIDLAAFRASAVEDVYEDEDLRDPSVFTFAYCGSVLETYDVWLVVDAMVELAKRGRDDVRFLVFGDGDDRERLETRCKDEGIDNVVFKGRVAKKFIPSIVTQVDANCISSTPLTLEYGLSGNKVFDYLAAGRPILSNVRVGHDIVLETGCGIVSEEHTAESFADAIERMADLPEEERAAMGEKAAQAAERFDFKVMTQELSGIFESVIEQHEHRSTR